jgi:hypothetical protein
LFDPLWKQAHDHLHGVNAQIMKSIVQSPVEYRAAALAATAMASRPGDIGMEADAATAFCTRMFSGPATQSRLRQHAQQSRQGACACNSQLCFTAF